MKRNILSALLIMLGIAYSNAQPGFESFSMNNQLVKDLSGYNWKMKMMRPGEGEKQGIHKIFPEDIETLVWNPAKVPGDVYTDLWKAGAIDDPYFGRNSVKAQWVQHYEWWYAAQFYVTEDVKNKYIRLEFDGVDYSCDVWLNGHYLGRHDGAFEKFNFEVTDYLRIGKDARRGANMLTVKLNPPTHINTELGGLIRSQGLAIADNPMGPFKKYELNPIISSGHETLFFRFKQGIASIMAKDGHENNTIQYSEDGKNFKVASICAMMPIASGLYDPDAFTDVPFANGITWGISHYNLWGRNRRSILLRFDCDLSIDFNDPEMKKNDVPFSLEELYRRGLTKKQKEIILKRDRIK